jgi:hypothetical protein
MLALVLSLFSDEELEVGKLNTLCGVHIVNKKKNHEVRATPGLPRLIGV